MGLNKRIINLIFGVSLSVLLLLIIFTYSRVATFKTYANFVSHSLAVQNDILSMKSSYRSIIANQRSYLLTKEMPYYHTFQLDKDSLRHTLEHYKKLTQKNQTHQKYIQRIENNVNNRIQSLLVEIINDTSSARYKFAQQELIARNMELNNDFSKTLSALYQYERQQMGQKLEIKELQGKVTPFLLFLIALIIVGVLAYIFLIVSNELIKRHRTEFALKENIENLNRSNKELEQYAYVASHDLQEPLRKIRTLGDRLQLKYKESLAPEAQDMLNRIDKSSQRMTSLIEDLLSLSRLLGVEPKLKEVELSNIIEEVKHIFSEEINAFEVDVQVANLPKLLASESQLLQLFQNIIGNAIKFRSRDRTTQIMISATQVAEWEGDEEYTYHKITVKDNGVGFADEHLEKMFAIFGRLQHTQNISGTGIGLSICSRIMQNHNGFMKAEGKQNEGATFEMFFPVLEL